MGLNSLWHLRGSVALSPVEDNEAVLARIEAMLDRQWKPIAERGNDFVAFIDPLWRKFVPNRLALAIYDRGVFWIVRDLDGAHLRYRLRSLHVLVFCLFLALIGFIIGFLAGGLGNGLAFAGAGFAWLYGMSLFLSRSRVPTLIEQTAAS